jgi:hypothetical protein
MPQLHRILKKAKGRPERKEKSFVSNVTDVDCDKNSMYLWFEVKCIIISTTGVNSNSASSVNKFNL